jgi:hypothetical protein
MLQSGNGCDELNVVTANRVHARRLRKSVSTVAQAQSAQLIPQQLRREPINALQVWHYADNEILGGHR